MVSSYKEKQKIDKSTFPNGKYETTKKYVCTVIVMIVSVRFVCLERCVDGYLLAISLGCVYPEHLIRNDCLLTEVVYLDCMHSTNPSPSLALV